ncbi:MAG: PilZ domain-containing protein [Deltaproteobacteria bacterium]|nr:PilZ domain-containing protein [Deltaproteobacteria bacterium]MCB9786785.1 PilZ domain-containing protein [Deltaproteobacteria bacterium]
MSTDNSSLIEVEELHEAIRMKRDLERNTGAVARGFTADQLHDLGRYIELLSNYGSGVPDRIEVSGTEDRGQAFALIRVYWETGSDLWRAVQRNLNKDGVFLQTEQISGMGDTILLEIVFSHPAMTIRVPSKVIWVNPHERSGRPMGMGLKFLWRNDIDRNAFRAFMRGDADVRSLASLQ